METNKKSILDLCKKVYPNYLSPKTIKKRLKLKKKYMWKLINILEENNKLEKESILVCGSGKYKKFCWRYNKDQENEIIIEEIENNEKKLNKIDDIKKIKFYSCSDDNIIV